MATRTTRELMTFSPKKTRTRMTKLKNWLIDRFEDVLIFVGEYVEIGLAWIDRKRPDPDLDQLVAEIEAAHERSMRNMRVSVKLPRDPARRMH
jgi:hypothetical protein